MSQIRARIREKRGVDYTEEEIRELARVKLEKFLDPGGVRSDLLAQFRRTKAAMPAPPNYAFEDSTLFESHRGFIRIMRKILHPILKLFFNPNPLIQALHIQSALNTRNAQREELDGLHYELIHNLVLETTRLGIEVKNLKMRLESMSSRLDFDERRARALEGVVQYRPGAAAPLPPPTGASGGERAGSAGRGRPDSGRPQPAGGRPDSAGAEGDEQRGRRRRRRGRRRGEPREGGGQTSPAQPQANGDPGEAGESRASQPSESHPEARSADSRTEASAPAPEPPAAPRAQDPPARMDEDERS